MSTENLFESRLTDGQKAENRVMQILANNGWTVNWNPKKATPGRDLFAMDGAVPYIIEVKAEEKQAHTGNICIELLQGLGESRLSGLANSDSSHWIHTLGDKAVVYRASPMRNHIKASRLQVFAFRDADCGNRGVLVRIADVVSKVWFRHCDFDDLPAALAAVGPEEIRKGATHA